MLELKDGDDTAKIDNENEDISIQFQLLYNCSYDTLFFNECEGCNPFVDGFTKIVDNLNNSEDDNEFEDSNDEEDADDEDESPAKRIKIDDNYEVWESLYTFIFYQWS